MTETIEIITGTAACTRWTQADYLDAEGRAFSKTVAAYLTVEQRQTAPDGTHSRVVGSYAVAAVYGDGGRLVPVGEFATLVGATLVHVSLVGPARAVLDGDDA